MREELSIKAIKDEYARLDAITGVDTANIRVSFSTRALYRRGSCKYKNNVPIEISISDSLRDDEVEFWDTVRHEYAHAVVKIRFPNENHGHDKVWKAVCLEVGCKPQRCAKVNEEFIARAEERMRYTVTCDCCGKTWKYSRAGKIVQELRRNPGTAKLTCPICNQHSFVLTEKG